MASLATIKEHVTSSLEQYGPRHALSVLATYSDLLESDRKQGLVSLPEYEEQNRNLGEMVARVRALVEVEKPVAKAAT
jgi:hypothetical protein